MKEKEPPIQIKIDGYDILMAVIFGGLFLFLTVLVAGVYFGGCP